MQDRIDAALDHHLGHVERCLGDRGVNCAAAVALLNHALGGGGEAVLDLLGHLGGGLEAHRLGQGVVQLGQHLLLHLLHGDHVLDGLALDLIARVVVGVVHRERLGVASLGAHERLGEGRQDALAAQLDQLPAGARTLDGLAVGVGLVVDEHEVALGGRTIGVLKACALLANAVDLLLHRALGNLVGLANGLEALVGTELRRGRHLQDDREGNALLVGVAQVNLGVADGVNAGGHQRLAVPVVQCAVERLGEDALATHPLHHHVCGHLARAEARDAHAARDFLDGAVELLAHLVLGDRDVDLDAVVIKLREFNGYGHGYSPKVLWG